MSYTYKDIMTNKIRFTKGKFVGFEEKYRFGKDFPSINYAVFKNRISVLYIPDYLLTEKTKKELKDGRG